MTTTPAETEETPREKALRVYALQRPRGADYNTGRGLDWERIRQEWVNSATPREIFTEPIAVKLMAQGVGATERGAVCEQRWQEHLAELGKEPTG